MNNSSYSRFLCRNGGSYIYDDGVIVKKPSQTNEEKASFNFILNKYRGYQTKIVKSSEKQL